MTLNTATSTVLAALLIGAAVHTAAAQTSPSLLISPWNENQTVELHSSALILGGGEADPRGPGDDTEADIRIYDVTGRARFNPDDPAKTSVGIAFTYIDFGNEVGGVRRLVDQSVALGIGLGRTGDWEFGAIVGVGYAGNNPFADCTAWYAKADLIASLTIDDHSSLQIILDYNGNRTIFPDAPLPAIAYNRRSSDALWYTVGLPYSSITWNPTDDLTLALNYAVPFTIDLTATWQFTPDLAVFAGLHNRYHGFFIDGLPRERRYFFRQRTAELGLRWSPCPNVALSLAGGYAFDQELEIGFDARDTDTVAEFSDEPFIRLAAELQF